MPSRIPPLNRRVLTVIVIIAAPILSLGARYVVASGQARVLERQSHELAQIAEYIASSTDAYVFRRIVDVAVIARVAEIRAGKRSTKPRPIYRIRNGSGSTGRRRRWRGC
jgi:hypothetical protein